MSTPTRGYKGPSTTARGKTKKILVLQTTSENPTICRTAMLFVMTTPTARGVF
jgi:hypothetical protein